MRRPPRTRHLVAIASLGLLGALGTGACTGLTGLSGDDDPQPAPPNGSPDGAACGDTLADHDNCGACGTVCGDREHCLDGRCAPGCRDHAVFVSADGNDGNDGCSPTTPKRTIGAAIALIKTLGAEKHEVRVCRGTYPESIVLDYATSIRGSFECSTWQRSSGYGAPTFEKTNASVVVAPAGAPALDVSAVSGVVVDGLTLRGADAAGDARSVGASVRSGASVTLSNDVISAGGGSSTASPASVGVLVDTAARLELSKSLVEGGSATKSSIGGYGSTGVHVTSKGGGLRVVESDVRGGGGVVSSGTGSTGILTFSSTYEAVVERSIIHGGTGTTGSGTAAAGLLLLPLKGDVVATGNIIDAGPGTCTAACSVIGSHLWTSGKVRFAGNRVTGGEADAGANDVRFTGALFSDASLADIQNNQIFSGNAKRELTSAAVALEVRRADTLLLGQNTLGLGSTLAGTGGAAIVDALAATIANNVFFNTATTVDYAVRVSGCDQSKVLAFRNNAWVGFPTDKPLLGIDKNQNGSILCTDAVSTAMTVAGAEVALNAAFGSSVAIENFRLAQSCSDTPARCAAPAACTTASGCVGALLGSFDSASSGGLLTAGWRIADGASCTIAKTKTNVPGLLATDSYGSTRTDPRSMGAHEHDGPCN